MSERKARKTAVTVERVVDENGVGDWRYSIEVDDQIDFVELLTADEVRSLIGVLQRALDAHAGQEGGAS